MDFAEMQALSVFEASLCPGCGRPMDVCATDYAENRTYIVDSHVCTATLSRAVQQRMDEWENTPHDKRPASPPLEAHWSDGRMYAPRLATDEEAEEIG